MVTATKGDVAGLQSNSSASRRVRVRRRVFSLGRTMASSDVFMHFSPIKEWIELMMSSAVGEGLRIGTIMGL